MHIDTPEPVEQWNKIDRRLVEKLDLETSVMNQQRLQLIHIGQVVPCSSCTSTVASTISSREIRLSCPHKGAGVALSTGNTTALRQDCIENHLSNKGLPYPKGSIATVTSIWNPRMSTYKIETKLGSGPPGPYIQSYTTMSRKA